MSNLICDMNCLNCKYVDCINDSDELSESENSFSNEHETYIKTERIQEAIRQIDDTKARANAKYRQTQKGKEMLHRMNTNDLAKERHKRYEQTNKAKERRKRHESKPERIAYRKEYMREYSRKYYAKKREEIKNASTKEQ